MVVAVFAFAVVENLLCTSGVAGSLRHIGGLYCIPESVEADGVRFQEGIPSLKSVLEVRRIDLEVFQIIIPRSAKFSGLEMAPAGGAIKDEEHLGTQSLEVGFRCSLRYGPLGQLVQSSLGICQALFGGFRSPRGALEVSKN